MGEQFCISCSKILNKNHGKLIQETLLEILQVIFDNSNLEAQRGSKICESCEEKVMVAFRFKVRCIYTDDRLHPYISRRVENNERVDLKKVYAKERQCETPSYGYICRLCLELVEESDKNLLIDSLRNKNLEDKFNIYLPEVNLEVTKDPIICKRCLQSLGEFMSFRRFIKNISEIVPQKQLNNGDHFKDNKAIHINSAKEEECSDNQEQLYLNTKYDPNCFERNSKSGKYKCKICLREFKTRGNVANHLRSHTEWLKCKLCSYKSKLERYLKKHEKIHDVPKIKLNHDFNAKYGPDSFERISKSGKYKCKICLREFQTRGNVKNHLHSHTGWLKCKVCSYMSKTKIYLKKHEKIHGYPKIKYNHDFNAKYGPDSFERISKSGKYKCKICLREFKTRGNVTNHLRSHIGWLKCKICSYKSKSKIYLKDHEKIHDVPKIELKIHKCNKCEYRTEHEQHLRTHEQNHHDFNAKDVPHSFEKISKSGLYRCKLCFRQFKTRANVANHIRSHTEWLKCKVCSYKSKREIFLKNHEKIHDVPEIENKYNNCEYKTKFKPNIRRHELLNHSTLFECHLCTFKTRYSYSFRNHHLFSHTIPVQYKCVSCSYKTTRIDHLGNHLKKAHPVTKMFKCSLCTYVTKLKKFLNEHMISHKDNTEVKMYQCYNCGLKTKYRRCLQTHIKMLHMHIPEDQLYKCRICSFVTKHKATYNGHMLRKHKQQRWTHREENQSRN